MGSATVYETTHGTAAALAHFYLSDWFIALLALLGINLAAALAVRFPWKGHQFGFCVTHLSVVLILAGAWVTYRFGFEARITLAEGETSSTCQLQADQLIFRVEEDNEIKEVRETIGQPLRDGLPSRAITIGGQAMARVQQYLHAAIPGTQVVEDSPEGIPAVQLDMQMGEQTAERWVFATDPEAAANQQIVYYMPSDQAHMQEILEGVTSEGTQDLGRIVVEVADQEYEISVADAMQDPAPIGQTGFKVRVLRQLPHASVGPEGQVTSASSQPVNPAVQLQFITPTGSYTEWAFARFPDMRSMHEEQHAVPIDARYVTRTQRPMVELVADTQSSEHVYVRFNPPEQPPETRRVNLGELVTTPWQQITFRVSKRSPSIMLKRTFVPASPNSDEARPAVQLQIQAAGETADVWVRKYTAQNVDIAGNTYGITYVDAVEDLGFELTLNDFEIGRYPGTGQPRTYVSQVVFHDPETDEKSEQTISMNEPGAYGGYRFYQSSFQENRETGGMSSVLSIARDPGQPIVFIGYIVLFFGMAWIVVTRVKLLHSQNTQQEQASRTSVSTSKPNQQSEGEVVS
jgi:hypothetical protein